ncbi:hypothetical protein F441_15421 [Phytophthora nicotianae CJ01A1]|uniref:FYVE-type domain-containing protein n=6 Tax=Phytophthora nicotianae TaxID=4792 RepID=W2R470_PHYN3|nr:hypothetical protein PPTG_04638 [Phytophthora nicotianae INRA-310]ETI38710.1 hypothetical protein F443_15604 [Phytophthora nicotianae P1569]ETK78925.1 hypothetical protein L915_15148 [Phytophthora nicotianae]ETO67506.1 hypothetical protein F444_15586 [Phytophthora nicotianae P1976]ETP08622.1 hypothetical protein F441_15421 [Phytophthora nicotianae CJ01A1]ETP36659.1 hypothetical protein F442_15437 [Phytophthora nicotianae P10297]KUF80377.1 hypothetical protein AM587_10015634 [Phytophthora n
MVSVPVQPPRQAAELSEEDQLKFQEMAMQLLDRTLRDLDEHDVEPRPHDKQDPRLWKKIHHKDHFTTYTRCDDAPEAAYVAADGGRSTTSRPSKDVVLGMGYVQCPLSELMYGVFMGDSQAMALKSAVVDKNIGNGAVLKQLMGPTEEDPFRFLALKWIEVRPPRGVSGKLVAPREVMFLGGTGTMRRRDTGEFIGYEVHHSIDHPAFPPVDGLRRTRIVIGSIYRERPNGTVDLFIKSYSMEADMGSILGPLAMAHAAKCIEQVWTVPDFAYAKKLRWCIDHRIHSNSVKAFRAKLAKRCASCDKSVANKIWQSRAAHRVCNLCKAPLCSSCRVKKDLYEIDPYFRARKFPVRICPPCREFVKQLDAKEVQRQETLRPQRPEVLNPLTPSTLDALARNFSLDNSFCTASVESLCMLDSPLARSDSAMTDLLN